MYDKATILAVDDSSEELSLLDKILTTAGYHVRSADTGELALADAATRPPDLILLDVRMKGMDGLEVCRRLKESETTRSIPIILVSGMADVKDWVAGLQLGAADYITKPFRTVELLNRVKTHLTLSRANVSLEQQAAALSQANEQLRAEVAERKRMEAALEKRLVALTRPLDHPEGITFEDLFDPTAIQRLQDEFSAATGVASIITHPDGTPITQPSNFCRLCAGIIRCTQTGCANCFRSDALLGHQHPEGPLIQPCLSGGLWDAGASITVGDRHIANWLIGQVRDETQSDEKMREYARVIGADEAAVVEAFHQVPAMPLARFAQIAQVLFTLTNQISASAYQNVQQARFISERKQAEEALRESERSLRESNIIAGLGNYVLNIPDGLWKSSDVLDQIFGIDATYDRTMDGWAALIHPDDRAMMLDYARSEVFGQRRTFDKGYRIIRQNDQVERWVHGLGNLEFDPQGRPLTLHGTIQDITQQKRLEESLRAAKETAETATRVKDQFLAKLSHELRTPLTPVLMAASRWQTQTDIPLTLRKELAMVCRNLELEARLLDDLLDVNRILYGKLSLRREVVNVHHAINEAFATIAPGVQAKKLVLTLKLQAAEVCVEGDPARMQQILWNLLSNAIKFTPEAGSISVSTANEPAGQIRVQITDSGMGIERGLLPRVFEPFEQGGQQINRNYGGLGMGMTICHALVEAHGGSITVVSDGSGKGATFTVGLPLSRCPAEIAPAASHRTQSESAAAGPLRILLVEDHVDTARMLSHLLRSAGYSVQLAGGVALALENLKHAEFDLLISDLGLPDGSGHDLMRQLVVAGNPIKAIVLSGYGTEDDLRTSREVGFAEHLVKPANFAKLQAAIERVVGAKRAGGAPTFRKPAR